MVRGKKFFIGAGVPEGCEGHVNCMVHIPSNRISFFSSPQEVVDIAVFLCTSRDYNIEKNEIPRRRMVTRQDDFNEEDLMSIDHEVEDSLKHSVPHFIQENDSPVYRRVVKNDREIFASKLKEVKESGLVNARKLEFIEKLYAEFLIRDDGVEYHNYPLFTENDISYALEDVPGKLRRKYKLMSIQAVATNYTVIHQGIGRALHLDSPSSVSSGSIEMDVVMSEIAQRW